MPEDNKKILYNNLIEEGYDLPEYDTFVADIKDKEKRSRLHTNLVDEGYDLPDFETFTSDMNLKKKEYTPEQLEAAETSLRGTSVAPSELDYEAPSTTKPEGDGNKLQEKLTEKIDRLYFYEGKLTPKQKIDKFTTQQGNLYKVYTDKADEFRAQGMSDEEINKKYQETVDSLRKGLGLIEEDGRISIPKEDIEKFNEIVKQASDLVVRDVNEESRQELVNLYKDQGFWDEMWKALKSGTLSQVISGIAGLKPLIADTFFEYIEKPILKAQGKDEEYINTARESIDLREDIGARRVMAEAAAEKAGAIELTMKQYEQGIIDSIVDGEWGTATRQITKGVVQSLPMMIAAGIAGGTTATAGLGVRATTSLSTLGTVSASARYLEVKDQDLMPEAYGKQLANAWLYGGLEATGEIFTMGIFGNMTRALKGLSGDALKKTTKQIAKSFGTEILGEGVSEGFVTELGQQLVDLAQGNRESIDFKQIGDATIIGSAAVAPVSTVTSTADLIKASRVATKEDLQKVNENIADINDLVAKKRDLEIDEESDIINEEIDLLIDENQKIFDKNEKIAKTLSTEEFNKVEKINERIVALEEEIEINKEDGVSIKAEEVLLENLTKQRDEILDEAIAEEVLKTDEQPKQEKVQEEEKVEPKKYESKEEFKSDFLSDEKVEVDGGEETTVAAINLQNVRVVDDKGQVLKQSTKEAAAKNIREGKDTQQARWLNQALDEAFDRGSLDVTVLTAGGKSIVEPVPIESIARPTKIQETKVEEVAETETKEVTGEQPTEETIEIPKKEKAVSERFKSKEKQTRGKETVSYKIVDEQSQKDEYSQDESYQKAANIVKSNIDENGNVDENAVMRDVANENPDVGNFALSQLENIYRRHSLMEGTSKEQSQYWERKASNIVNMMADRALNQGRGAASWAKIYKENPAFDARVRFAEVELRRKANILQETMEGGRTVDEYINSLRDQLKEVIQKEVEQITKENVKLRAEIGLLKKHAAKPKYNKTEAKRIADKVRTLKAPRDLMFATPIPVQAIWNPSVEIVAKAIEATGNIAEAIQKGLDWVKKQKWYKDLTKEQQDGFDKFYAEKVKNDIERQEAVPKVIKEHFKSDEEISLEDRLIRDSDLTKTQARRIARLVNKEVRQRVSDELMSIKEQHDTKWKRSEINKLVEALEYGDINEEEWVNSFTEKFGFIGITEEMADAIKILSQEIDKAFTEKKYFLAKQRQIELSNLVKKLKKKDQRDLLEAINNWQYAAILSGAGTFYNAGVGSATTLTLDYLPSLISKGILPAFFGVKMGIRFLKTHLKEFMTIINTNRGYFDDLGLMDEAYKPSNEGAFDIALAKPFFHYSKEFVDRIRKGKWKDITGKFLADWGKQTLVKAMSVVAAIKAQDALLRGSAIDIMMAADEFNNMAEKTGHKGVLGRLTRLKDVIKIVDGATKNLAMDTESNRQIKAQVQKEIARGEGKRVPNYASRRAYELRIQKGNEKAYKQMMIDATDAVMLGTPDGIPGYIFQVIQRAFTYTENTASQIPTFLLRTFLLFPRITMNFGNRVFNNVPIVGALNAVMGYEVDPVTKQGRWTTNKFINNPRKATRRLVTHAALVAAGMSMFLDMFDWDDDEDKFVLDPDRHFDFTSYGTGSYKLNKQYGITKNFGWKFRWDNDKEFREDFNGAYLAPHILPMIGILGRMADDAKGVMSDKRRTRLESKHAKLTPDDKEWINQMKVLTQQLVDIPDISIRAFNEARFNSVGRALDKVRYAQDKGVATFHAVADIVSEPIKVMSQPRIFKDMINEGYRHLDVPQKDSWRNAIAQTTKGWMLTESFMQHDKTDIYGNPLPRQSNFTRYINQYNKEHGGQPEYELLWKYDALKRPNQYWMPDKEGYTDDDKQEARQYAREGFRYYVKDNIKYLDELEQANLEKALDVYWHYAKDAATYAIDYSKAKEVSDKDKIDKAFKEMRDASKIEAKVMKKMIEQQRTVDEILTEIDENILRDMNKLSIGKY